MANRPEDGYRATGRIGGGSGGRSRLVLGAIAVIVAGWLAVTLTSRPSTAVVAAPSGPISTGAPFATDPVELPPFVDAFQGAPTSPIPILLGGLASLNVGTASITRPTSNRGPQWPFLLADGSTICVCLIGGQSGLAVARTPSGELMATERLVEGWTLPADADRAFLDVALDGGSGSALVASAALRSGVWEVRLDRVSLDAGLVGSTTVGTVAAADLDEMIGGGVRIWLAPDGRHARIALASRVGPLAQPAPPATVREWLVDTSTDELGPVEPIGRRFDDPAPGECQADGWATPDTFVRICLEPGSSAGPDIVLHQLAADGSEEVRSIATAREFDNQAWLIDGSAGVVYGWSAWEQILTRFDVRTGQHMFRVLPVPNGTMSPVEAPWPDARPEGAAWVSGEAGRGSTLGGFVGSPDGSVLYAAGLEPDTEPLEGISNGIFAFDAATLAVLGHWVPSGTYESLGITADARYLLALGPAPPADIAAFGDLGSNLVIHDARTGDAVAILRRVETRLDGNPSFLVARPGS